MSDVKIAFYVMAVIAALGAAGNLVAMRTNPARRKILALAFALFALAVVSFAEGWSLPLTISLVVIVFALLLIDVATRSAERKDLG